jgi:drug/metabolite transporter (DMT)-like permease
LFALAGALSALIRITIIAALQHAGPDVTAAITPATPVITLVATLALGMETLRVHAPSGKLQVAGLSLCSMSACSMAFLKGPILFGTPPSGAHAPTNIPLGASFMLFNCVISAMVQIVNKKALALYPLLSATACVEAFAVSWLSLLAAATAPRKDWWIDGSVAAAVLFGGLFATAMNNILLARANKRLGPLVANMYVPVQPLTTATLDFIFLGDAFYTGNFVCGMGVIAGLVCCKVGKVRELREVGDDLRAKVLGTGDAGPDDHEVLAAASLRLVRRRSLHLLAQPPSGLVDAAMAHALQGGTETEEEADDAPAGADAETAGLLGADSMRDATGV